VQGKDKTYDEPRHLHYGTNILNGDSTRFDDSKMPFSAWNALPAKLGENIRLPEGILKAYLPKLITARLMTTLFSMLVAFIVFYWSRELYGFVPALASLILYIFDPNIIAHSQLVTTDIYVAGMILFAVYWLWRFANNRTWQNGLWCAIMLGLAQLAKYTAVALYPIFLLTLIVYDVPATRKVFETEGWRALAKSVIQYLKYVLITAVISILIINLGFLFNRSFTPLREYSFRSDLFKAAQSEVSFVVPVPYPYLEGLDWIAQREHDNEGFEHIYLLGETRFGQGFPGYYFVASLLKVPIATQIVLIAPGKFRTDRHDCS
jgi:4-amino-4-deoxy-L-arabinose transferase-like glycosyltransferase